MAAYIHHVQLCTRNGAKYVQKFVQNANFRLFAERNTASLKQWAVRSGSAVFIINQHVLHRHEVDEHLAIGNGHDGTSISSTTTTNLTSSSSGFDCQHNGQVANSSCSNPSYKLKPDQIPRSCQEIPSMCFSPSVCNQNRERNVDTVFNVALEVCNVEKSVARAQANGANIMCEPTVVHDNSGKVVIAAVQSCIGNVVHTLMNTTDYHGVFLPGFHSVSNHHDLQSTDMTTGQSPTHSGEVISHIDHITYACHKGDSGPILDWYEKCFGMKRFKLSSDEDDVDGFLIEGENIGLRMKAMEYWRCAEIGIAMPTEGSKQYPNPKFVVGEALPGQGPNQVETFLDQHRGAGIQHIGLYAPSIINTVRHLTNAGMQFVLPPASYYTEIGKLAEIEDVGESTETLKQLGILLDAESFTESKDPCDVKPVAQSNETSIEDDNVLRHRYLMQIFTKPIFDQDTFFLEIIQRFGAYGFGAGNITALWRAIEHYMQEEDKMKEKDRASSSNS